jgi:putative ABC transport system substrate-binding protein
VRAPETPGLRAFEREVFANTAHAGLGGSYVCRQTRRALLTRLTRVGLVAAGFGLSAACDRLPGLARPVPRIGWVANQAPAGDPLSDTETQALVAGLGDYGYIPGQNLQMESRFPSDASQNAEMISDLLRSGVDVLVTGGTAATVTAKQATSTVPIVGIYVGDPVGAGLTQSLARPGGNVTAIANGATDITGKLLDLLRLLVPTLSRVGFLYDPENASHVRLLQQFGALVAALGLEALPAPVPTFADFDVAFETAVANGVEALIDVYDRTEGNTRVAALALSHHLVSMANFSDYPSAGGLLSYGPDLSAVYRRGAYYVDRVLKGTQPADLPVEFPTAYDMVVNQATAKALGVTIPDEVAQQVTSWI